MVCSFNLERGGPVSMGPHAAGLPIQRPLPRAVGIQCSRSEKLRPRTFERAYSRTVYGCAPARRSVTTQSCSKRDLTYLSDLGTGFGQQAKEIIGKGGPSIDHSMWFQEPIGQTNGSGSTFGPSKREPAEVRITVRSATKAAT